MSSSSSSSIVAASASSSSTLEEYYDVFLSFRGDDTRNKFTSHLYAALKGKNIKTYFDEESLGRGEEISPSLMEAIRNSKISVVVFSENYAYSRWCLRELVCIIQCLRDKSQTVLPIFYEVDPSDVRNQRGSYGDAFLKHERDLDKIDMIRQWREALTTSTHQAGFDSRNFRLESKLVEEVVNDIWDKLCNIVSLGDDFKDLFGFESKFRKVESLLSIGLPNVGVVGIWGMGGIGKTTLAEKIFHRFKSQFQSCCFLEHLREEYDTYGPKKLLVELISKLLNQKIENLETSSIPDYMKTRLRSTKVLIVLDDLSDSKQLECLNIGDHVSDIAKQFGDGSRIIITSRDARVLRGIGVGVETTFEVKKLEEDEGLQLFNLTAFKGEAHPSDYIKLSNQVVKKVGCNPLAIKLWGSHFRSLPSPSKEKWQMELDKLNTDPLIDKIHTVLKISYDALDKEGKSIFLDIACFLRGVRKDFVEVMYPSVIQNLTDKSLISFSHGKLDMHDLVQEMGRTIVSEEPGVPTRPWSTEEAWQLLMNNDKGTEKIEGIFLNKRGFEKCEPLRPTVFRGMCNLRFLSVWYSRSGPWDSDCYSSSGRYHSVITQSVAYEITLEALEFLPHSLRFLEWQLYPLASLPSNFNAQNLIVLSMITSKLEQLWNEDQELNNLKIFDLAFSRRLTKIPDLSRARKLEVINLQQCNSLIQFPWHSLRYLDELAYLNLSGCKKVCVPTDRIGGKKLRTLDLHECRVSDTVPENITTSLESLTLSYTAIPHLPSSIGFLKKLLKLDLTSCYCLKNVPNSIRELDSLKVLKLGCCSSLEMFPELPRNIEEIDCTSAAIKEVPSALIKDCPSLRSISLRYCHMLESLPTSIFESRSLASLDLLGCRNLKNLPGIAEPVKSLCTLVLNQTGIEQLPESIGNLTGLQSLYLTGCANLRFLPPSIGNLLCLRWLYLAETGIEQLPESIGKLICLKRLTLYSCRSLGYLPPSIGDLLSLCSLSLGKTGIKQLPESIGKLTRLQALYLEGCRSPGYWPRSIRNLRCLHRPNLKETGIEQLPESIGDLLCLKDLTLDYSDISEIPPSIKRLPKLRKLSVKCLDNLVSLPELPVSLECLNAAECRSLKLVSPPNRALIQGLGDNDEIANNEFKYSASFDNCLELDENAKLNIISCFQLRVLRKATRFVPNEDQIYYRFDNIVETRFPGFEIPNWFDQQNEGASINIKLPRQWHNSNFLGFAVCAVVRECQNEGGNFCLDCTINLSINAEDDQKFHLMSWCSEHKVDSNHVCMWYQYHNYSDCADAPEAKINFSCEVRGSDQIKRCGMRVLYREDLEEFRAQYLLLDQSAAITDQPGPSARGTFISDLEEPLSKRAKHSNSM